MVSERCRSCCRPLDTRSITPDECAGPSITTSSCRLCLGAQHTKSPMTLWDRLKQTQSSQWLSSMSSMDLTLLQEGADGYLAQSQTSYTRVINMKIGSRYQ